MKAPVTGDYEVGFSGTGSFRVWFNGQLRGRVCLCGQRQNGEPTGAPAGGQPRTPSGSSQHRKDPGGHAKLLWHRPDAGKDYTEAVRKADLVIVALGLTSELEGEEMPIKIPGFQGGDRTSLDLPRAQQNC